jgi:hypothetical protein
MMLAMFALALVQVTPMPGPVTVVAPAKPKLICREGDQQLGTHMHADRVCKTAEQWDADDIDVHRRLAPPSLTIHKDQLEGAPNVQPQ